MARIGDPRDHRLDAWPGPEPLHRPAHACRRPRRAPPCGSMVVPAAEVDALSRWTGGIDLYRSGVFTTQKTWLWCTAADVQIIRNIADHATDHSRSASSATSTTCAPTTGTRSRSRTGSIRRAGPPGLDDTSTAASSWPRAGASTRRSDRGHEPAQDEPAGRDHGVARQPAWVMTGFTATADPAVDQPVQRDERAGHRAAVGLQSRRLRLRHAARHKLTPGQLDGLLHAMALRAASGWPGRVDGCRSSR